MELMINVIMGVIGTIMINLVSNSIHDKIKNHSSSANRRCGYNFEFTLLSIKFKKK